MQLTIIAATLAGVLAFGSAWKIQDWRFDSKEKERLEQVQEAKQMREKQISAASVEYEKKKEVTRVKYVTITQEVEKIVDRPVYKNICLDDDGIKLINEGITP